MKGKGLFLTLAIVSVALAGCTGGDAADELTAEAVDIEDVQLATGKGAIQGLLIDDRFRPIADGTILLQPVGMQAESNENGEFNFLDLDPGAYTLKVSAEGHEASPQTVNVAEAEFAEANVVARRVLSEGGAILTREFGVFIGCWAESVVIALTWHCGTDLSGDSSRAGFESDLTGEDNITYLITEVKMENPGKYGVSIRDATQDDLVTDYFAEADIIDDDYVKITMKLGEVHEEHNAGRNIAWNNTVAIESLIFPMGDGREYTGEAGLWGIGGGLGVQGKIIQSVFLNEPEVDIASYAVLG